MAREPVSRPRYRRITAAGSAGLVTLVAVLGATGILPTSSAPGAAFAGTNGQPAAEPTTAPKGLRLSALVAATLPRTPDLDPPQATAAPSTATEAPTTVTAAPATLPDGSGDGRRVVFDMSDQRVWLVSDRDRVRRTYLVSGSLTDNLGAGRYDVYSRSRDATGVDDSGTMRYMVRFAHGTRAAIGFHDIPVHEGKKLQTLAQLGTPQSHGCIRQRTSDARALWDFASLGTQVVVLH